MIGVTVFGLFLTPIFYYVVRRLAGGHTPAPVPPEGPNHTVLQAVSAARVDERNGPLKVTTHE